MPVAFVLVGLAVVLLVALLAIGWFGELPESTPDRTPLNLPPGALDAQDVSDVRFAVGVRGYRMDEVDTVLERVTTNLAERDAHIEFLQQRFSSAGIDPYASSVDDVFGPVQPQEPTPEPGTAPDPGPLDPADQDPSSPGQ